MRKFLAFLIFLVVAISLTMMTFALLKEGSILSYAQSRVYYNYSSDTSFLDKEVKINYEVDGKQNRDTVSFKSSDETVAVVDNKGAGPVKLVGAGQTTITVVLTNARGKEQSFEKTIRVGNGTNLYPYYIYNEATLVNMAKASGEYAPFTAASHYIQIENIVLNNEFESIETQFDGSYNGNGFSVINYTKTTNSEYSAMFNKIGQLGKVGYVNFENVNIVGNFNVASVVANVNLGFIDMVNVSGNLTNTNGNTTAYTAGIAGSNKIYLDSYSESLTLIGTISRSTNRLNILAHSGIVGGIAGFNEGKITACISGNNTGSTSAANIVLKGNSGFRAGGIVGINQAKIWAGKTDEENAKYKPVVADSYVSAKIKIDDSVSNFVVGSIGNVGGIIGENYNVISGTDASFAKNNVFGNYYITENLAGALSSDKIYNSGIGNNNGLFAPSTSTNESTASKKYVALGITAVQAIDGNVLFAADIVSSIKDSGRDLKTWNKQVWIIGKAEDTLKMYPILNPEYSLNFASKDFVTVPQIFNNKDNLIYDVDTFRTVLNENTDTNNKKTYRIVKDIDFTGEMYDYANLVTIINDIEGKMVNSSVSQIETTPNYNPEENWAEGSGTVTISNLTIDVSAVNNLDPLRKMNFGIFGEVRANISNIIFDNVTIIGDDSTTNVGILAGRISSGNVSNIEIRNSKIETVNGAYTNVGGLAGAITGGNLSDNKVDAIISAKVKANANLGGIAGFINEGTGAVVISGLTVNVSITQTNTSILANAAGLAVTISGAEITNVKLYGNGANNEDLNGYNVYGIALSVDKDASLNVIETGFGAGSQAAGGITGVSIAVGGVGKLSGSMKNIHLATGFRGAATAVGLVNEMAAGSKVEWAVVENNFLNSSDKYAKTVNKPRVTFTGDERPYSSAKKDFSLIPYHNGRNLNSNVDAELNNVFYSTNITSGLKVYTVYDDWGIVDEGSFGKSFVAIFAGTNTSRMDYANNFNGGYATGRIDSVSGSMITLGSSKSKSYHTSGFDTNVWNLAGIPNLK